MENEVAVYTQDFTQVFPLAYVLQAVVKEDSKVMEHPLETGATIIDHKITLPVEIELSLILDPIEYQNTYQEIKQLYLNATLLTVQLKASVYQNQIISSMPHEENTETFNTITIALKLRQALFVTPQVQTLVPRAPADKTTVNRGAQTPAAATPAQTQSFAKTGKDYFNGKTLPPLPPPRRAP